MQAIANNLMKTIRQWSWKKSPLLLDKT